MLQPGLAKLSACCVSLLVFGACGGGGSSPAENSSWPDAAKTIGPEGGVIEIHDPANRLDRTRIIIPAGALKDAVEITISQALLPDGMPGSSFPASDAAVEFGPQGLTFLKPVTITLGYVDSNNNGFVDGTGILEEEVGILYTSGGFSDWLIYNPLARDPYHNTVTFQTTHFSTYLSFVGDPAAGNGNQADPVTTTFLPGEHFVSNPSYTYDQHGTPTPYHGKAPHYYLTILRPKVLEAWIDTHLNLSGPGLPCPFEFDEGNPFSSCTFDATIMFPKVGVSGNTALWDWQCDFVAEHTILRNYLVYDETIRPDKEGAGIYCEMEAVIDDPTSVRINWGINVNEEVWYVNHDLLGIRFRAHYIGP